MSTSKISDWKAFAAKNAGRTQPNMKMMDEEGEVNLNASDEFGPKPLPFYGPGEESGNRGELWIDHVAVFDDTHLIQNLGDEEEEGYEFNSDKSALADRPSRPPSPSPWARRAVSRYRLASLGPTTSQQPSPREDIPRRSRGSGMPQLLVEYFRLQRDPRQDALRAPSQRTRVPWEEGQPLGPDPTNPEAVTQHLGWIMPRLRKRGVGLGGDPTDSVANAWRKGHLDIPIPSNFKMPSEPWSSDPKRQVTMVSNKGNTFMIESKESLLARNRTIRSPEESLGRQMGNLSLRPRPS
ncbi:hypothetical protein F4821DRAFT_257349 [Hypoxylon rubiginosum]|uniref:Uncharacterized protein n=1 Tax=Hypoxylon rubiginosum TaxID=110542 RepID=A0ACC0D940_9PEZI|nr:hypothetical protein F4821DRAFT_257349 [Hypoxylon rubiginosum]